jgi:CysZ protein
VSITKPVEGARYLLRGFSLIRRPGLRRFVAIPLLVNLLLFGSAIFFGGQYFDGLMERLLPDYLDWLEFLIWPLFALMVLVLAFYTFTLVANLFGAPFNDRLAEKVASRMGASLPNAESRSLVGDVAQSIFGELRKWLYFLGLMALVLLCWIIPLTTVFAPFLWLLLSAWMMSVEYTDYPMANTGLTFSQRRAWLRQHRGLAIGFGAATLGATMIPVVNFAVMPAAVAGATLLWVDHGPDRSP